MDYKLIGVAAAAFVAGGIGAYAWLQSGGGSSMDLPSLTGSERPAPAADDPIVAKVDDDAVRLSDLQAAKALLPAEVRQMPVELIYRPLLDRVVDSRLMVAAAYRRNVQDDPELRKRMALVGEQLLQDAYLNKIVDEKITDSALRTRYDEYVKELLPEDEVHARHILVETEDAAADLIRQLDSGADFAQLAQEKSAGPSKDKGGDLGYFARGDMVKEFSDAAFELEIGKYSAKPIKTQFGWHVIKVEDRRRKAPPKFEDISDNLARDMSREVLQQTVAELRSNAKIERFNIDGTPMKEEPADVAGPQAEQPAEPASEAPEKKQE